MKRIEGMAMLISVPGQIGALVRGDTAIYWPKCVPLLHTIDQVVSAILAKLNRESLIHS